MPSFRYKAIDRQGRRYEGVVEAMDRRGAISAVGRLGRMPVSIEEATKAKEAPGSKWWKLSMGASAKISKREVLLFTEELSDLLAAGMTLGNALNSLASSGEGAFSLLAADLRDRIIRGEALSDAVRAHPETFPPLYGNMIRAGEASGALPDVLRRLIEHYERMLSMKERIAQAMTYPIIVLVLGLATVVFAMVKIVPQFVPIFSSMGVALPLSTRILIGASGFVQRNGLFIAVAAGLISVFAARGIKTEAGKRIIDRLKLKLPLVKGIVASGIFASFARTLETLLANGVPVVNALKITEETVGNAVIADELRHVRARVVDGTSISGPLAQGGVFPKMMTDLIAIGEQTGDMPSALGHVGRRYENEMDKKIKVFTAALEPILIVLVAGVVGFIAISILSAVFKVSSGIGV